MFFAFPDGVFHYVCAECDALCCKGQGFGGSVHREMPFLLKTYPALSAAVTARRHDHLNVVTPRGRCFFLQPDNLCQIEFEHGRSRKPGVCMAFPFNRFVRIGEWLAVMPYFICPLRINVPASPGSVTGTHALIEETLRETEMLSAGYISDQYNLGLEFRQEESQSIIRRLQQFRDTCSDALGARPFRDVILAESEDADALAAFGRRAIQIMQWESPEISSTCGVLDNILLALAPSISVEMAAFPRERSLRILLLSNLLVHAIFRSSMYSPTPQQVNSMIMQSMSALALLSSGDDIVMTVDRAEAPMLGTPELVLAAGLILEESKSAGLFTVLEKNLSSMHTPADRTILMHYIAGYTADSK